MRKTDPTPSSFSSIRPLADAINAGALEIADEKSSLGLAHIAFALGQLTRPPRSVVREGEISVTPVLGGKQQEQALNANPNAFLFPFLLDSAVPPCFLGPVCGVACFNMAVAYHVEAVKSTCPQERLEFLECAKELYLQADDLVSENPDVLDCQGSMVYVYMATCHNLAAIHNELGENSHERREYLVNTFIFCVAESHDNPLYRYFTAAAGM